MRGREKCSCVRVSLVCSTRITYAHIKVSVVHDVYLKNHLTLFDVVYYVLRMFDVD